MVTAVVGANWGDEGKGKITDMLGEESDIIVRFQGGSNAGHTIINNYGKFALHLLPSGVFYDHTTSIIGNGVALNIPYLFNEINDIVKRGVPKPKILILDDSTSAVDTKTDKLIRSAFHNEIPDTTKIIIAQRVASVQESDMILVMDSGRIMASGTHDELLATCDEYRSIYESQTKNQAQPEELAAAEQAAESSTAEPSETVTVTVTMPTADTSAADANAADTKEGEAR